MGWHGCAKRKISCFLGIGMAAHPRKSNALLMSIGIAARKQVLAKVCIDSPGLIQSSINQLCNTPKLTDNRGLLLVLEPNPPE
jgi:hypothetical protein